MKRRILSLLLALTMVVSLLPVMSLAEAPSEEQPAAVLVEPAPETEQGSQEPAPAPDPEPVAEPEPVSETPVQEPVQEPVEEPAPEQEALPAQEEPTEVLTLDREELELQVGESVQLNAAKPGAVWFSSNESVAQVDDAGNVTALAEGTAIITAALGEEKAECLITVLPALAVQSAAQEVAVQSSVFDEEIYPVEITFSLSEDERYVQGENGAVLAKKTFILNYFDLANYGLEKYYFQSSSYEVGGVTGTAETAYGHITMLHALIYMLEVYYCGVDPADVGQGYLKDAGLIGTSLLNISGGAGSLFLQEFWNHDLNLTYYINYEYPLASEGTGSTADQIELWDGDEINLAMYADWGFFSDENAGFTYIQAKGYIKQGDELAMTVVKSWGDMMSGSASTTSPVTTCPDVYRALRSDLEDGSVGSDFGEWIYVGQADESGELTVDTSDWEPGEYIVACPGQPGASTANPVSSPGSAVVTVRENPNKPTKPVDGDVNGDNVLSSADAALVYRYTNGSATLTDAQLKLADLNKDGKVTAVDAAILYRKVNNTLS